VILHHLRAGVLFGVMPPDEASRPGTQQPVVAGVVSGNTADYGTLETARSVGLGRRYAQRDNESEPNTAIDFISCLLPCATP